MKNNVNKLDEDMTKMTKLGDVVSGWEYFVRKHVDENILIEAYGVTDNPKLAGYITESGLMLDFNEESIKGSWSIRSQDHRSIGYYYLCDPDDSIDVALNDGLIRIDYGDVLYINLNVWPSDKQIATLKKISAYKKIYADIYKTYGIKCNTFDDFISHCAEHCK